MKRSFIAENKIQQRGLAGERHDTNRTKRDILRRELNWKVCRVSFITVEEDVVSYVASLCVTKQSALVPAIEYRI